MTIQWVPVARDTMASWAYLFLVSGILIDVSRGDYCLIMEQGLLSRQSKITDVCASAASGSTSQCSPHDLTTIMPMGTQYNEASFWIERGNLCTSFFCPALVRNTSDPVALNSIQCLTCSENHAFMCNFYGTCNSRTVLPVLTTENHTGSCQNNWKNHSDMEYMISPIRRTLQESQSWCTMMNGSASLSKDALKYVEHMTLPHPKMAYYWIAVPHIGQLLTTNKNEGKTFTNTFNIIERGADAEKLYGCICIRTNGDATSTSTSTTTTTTPTTTQTTTKTTITTTTGKPPLQIHDTGVTPIQFPCNNSVLMVYPNTTHNHTTAAATCRDHGATLWPMSDLQVLNNCVNNKLGHKLYWLLDRTSTGCGYLNTRRSPYTSKTRPCVDFLDVMCKLSNPTAKSNETPPPRWQIIHVNNTYVHVVTENLTQPNATLACKQLFGGNLLHMTMEMLFTEMRRIKTSGMYWIEDFNDTNFTDDCLVFSREEKGSNSIQTVPCNEGHYTLCQSVADHDILLNSAFLKDIIEDLVIKNGTSKDFRAKNTVWDERISSHVVGGSGLIFMLIFAGIVGAWDLPYLKYIWLYFKGSDTDTDDE